MVLGSGKESARSLGIRIEFEILVIKLTSDYFLDIRINISQKKSIQRNFSL